MKTATLIKKLDRLLRKLASHDPAWDHRHEIRRDDYTNRLAAELRVIRVAISKHEQSL